MYIVYVHVSILHKICHPTWQCNDLFKPHDERWTKLFFIAFLSKLNKQTDGIRRKKCRDVFHELRGTKKMIQKLFPYLYRPGQPNWES